MLVEGLQANPSLEVSMQAVTGYVGPEADAGQASLPAMNGPPGPISKPTRSVT